MRDFTTQLYLELILALRSGAPSFQTFAEYLAGPVERTTILRHDVDKMPVNSLIFARLEQEAGIKASYYFRIVPESFDAKIIREIASLGHEIGYHYEDMDLCKGNTALAYKSFRNNLARLREFAPIATICMHGSPLSRFDNRDLWKYYDYREDGIVGEPYFDVDYSKLFYITDTGRKWNNSDSNIRDKVQCAVKLDIANTRKLIAFAEAGKLPHQIMINTHPQRWNDNIYYWTREYVMQGIKNPIKRIRNLLSLRG